MQRIAKIINGRRIVENDPVGSYTAPWYTVELRGPKFEGESIYVFVAFDNLQAAITDAERRGQIPTEFEADQP